MFNVPITIIVRFDDRVDRLVSSVNIDDIAVVNPLDNEVDFDVECNELYDFTPRSELVLIDGRKLPVREHPAEIIRYLDAYRQLEDFFTAPVMGIRNQHLTVVKPEGSGVVVPLFGSHPPCALSEGSTPA